MIRCTMTRAVILLAFSLLLPAPIPCQAQHLLPKRITGPAKDDKTRGVDFVASVDSFDLQVLTEIEGAPEATLAFGDTDHDGRNEIIKIAAPCSYRIFEEQGNGVYALQYSGPCLYPMATGDLDEDGLSDLVGESSCCIQIY